MRRGAFILLPSPKGFNPRTRKGCDIILFLPLTCQRLVSIHAPVKDATSASYTISKKYRVSIHAPVKDATRVNFDLMVICKSFNPRTRKGCDKEMKEVDDKNRCFNPRTRKGCDSMFMESFIDNIFSI